VRLARGVKTGKGLRGLGPCGGLASHLLDGLAVHVLDRATPADANAV